MARKMIEYVSHIFSKLAEDIHIPTLKDARILPPPAALADALMLEFKGLRISEPDYLIHDVRFFEVHLDSRLYLGFVNLNIPDSELQTLESEKIINFQANDALLLAIIKDADINRSPLTILSDLEQHVLFQQEFSDYKGHDLQELAQYFEKISLFNIQEDGVYSSRPPMEIAFHIASHDPTLINPKLKSFVTPYRSLLSHEGSFMKQNIFWSMTSSHYKHAFLELYRCIESIYTLPRALSLKQKMGLTISGYQVARMCIDELGWRRKEEDSLIKIFMWIPDQTLDSMNLSTISCAAGYQLNFSSQELSDESKKSAAKLMYRIRNQMVHQFETGEELTILPTDWPIIICLLLSIIEHIYTIHAAELPQTPQAIKGV